MKKINRKCLFCKKETQNSKFCSLSCSAKYRTHILKISNFYNSDYQKQMAMRAVKSNKINKKGLWGISKEDRIKTGKIAGKIRAKQMKENKTGFYDINISILGGKAAQKIISENHRNLKYENNYYDSRPEIEISICLQEQFNYKPVEGKTLHFRINKFEYDYFLDNVFIEYHQFNGLNKLGYKDYYTQRRENLNKNGFEKYPLVVIR